MPASRRQKRPRVEVIADDAQGRRISRELRAKVAQAAAATLAAEHTYGPDGVTVYITGDETLRDLNLRHRGLDEVTDVLSFNEAEGWRDGRPPAAAGRGRAGLADVPDTGFPGEEATHLGSMAISLPQVERQAAAAGHSTERELAMLTIHGVLHLLGYDHAAADEERVMSGKTDHILASLFEKGGKASQPEPLRDRASGRGGRAP